MSTQTPPILLGPRSSPGQEQFGESDLQQALGKVFEVLRRRRWLFILPLLSGALIVLMVSLFVPRRYVATASFERSDDVVVSSLIQASTPFSFNSLRDVAPVDLLGYSAVARAVDQLGLLDDLPRDGEGRLTEQAEIERRRFITDLSSRFSYRVSHNSKQQDVIQLRYEGDRPKLGEQMLARLMDNYVTLMQSRITDVLDRSYEFFHKEAAARKKRVARLMWEQIQFGLDHPGVVPSDPDVLDRRLAAEKLAFSEVTDGIEETASRIAAHQAYLEELQAGTAGVETLSTRPAGADAVMELNPRWQKLSHEVEKFEEEIADLRAGRGMTDLHPEIVALSNKIEVRQREMEQVPQWLTVEREERLRQNPQDALRAEERRIELEIEDLQQALAALRERKLELESAIRDIEADKQALYQRREQFVTMEQELQNARKDLELWNRNAEKLEQVRVVTSQDRGIRFAVVSDPRAGLRPEYPTQLGVFSMAAGVGIALGAMVIFLRELFDRSFRHPARVRRALGIPVLETIGEIPVRRNRGWIARQRLLPAVAMVETVAIMALVLLVRISLEEPEAYGRIIGSVRQLWPM